MPYTILIFYYVHTMEKVMYDIGAFKYLGGCLSVCNLYYTDNNREDVSGENVLIETFGDIRV